MLQYISFIHKMNKDPLEIKISNRYSTKSYMCVAVETAWETRKTQDHLRGADLRGLNLIDINLEGASLEEASLAGANLMNANLMNANLSGANLINADLSGANLSEACLNNANLTSANLPNIIVEDVPVIKNLDYTILKRVEENPGTLNMRLWHSPCGTAHCRAGWAVSLAGEAGRRLENKLGTAAAASLIYHKSVPEFPIPDFYCTKEEAIADMHMRVKKLGINKDGSS